MNIFLFLILLIVQTIFINSARALPNGTWKGDGLVHETIFTKGTSYICPEVIYEITRTENQIKIHNPPIQCDTLWFKESTRIFDIENNQLFERSTHVGHLLEELLVVEITTGGAQGSFRVINKGDDAVFYMEGRNSKGVMNLTFSGRLRRLLIP